jgi:hypothetical protein
MPAKVRGAVLTIHPYVISVRGMIKTVNAETYLAPAGFHTFQRVFMHRTGFTNHTEYNDIIIL